MGAVVSGARVIMILRNKAVLHFNGKNELLVMGIEKIWANQQAQGQAGKEGSKVSAQNRVPTGVENSMDDSPGTSARRRSQRGYHGKGAKVENRGL